MQNNTKTREPGFGLTAPKQSCDDYNCPFHGSLKLRGKTFTGIVVSAKMQRSAVVSWEGRKFVPKYERYKRTRTKISVHNPSCIAAKEGDTVLIRECRPISKTKSFVVVQNFGQKNAYELEKSLGEEGKHKLKKKEIVNKESVAENAEKPADEQ